MHGRLGRGRRLSWRSHAITALIMALAASWLVPQAGRSAAAVLPGAVGADNTPLTIEFSGHIRDGYDERLPASQVATRSQWFNASWDVEYTSPRANPVTARDLADPSWRTAWPAGLPLTATWLGGRATDTVVDIRPGVSCSEAWQREDPPPPFEIIGRIPGRAVRRQADELVLEVPVAWLFYTNSSDYCQHLAFLSSLSWPRASRGPQIPYKPAWAFGQPCACADGWNNWVFRRDHAVFTIPLNHTLTPQTVSVFFHAHDDAASAVHEWDGTISVLPPTCPTGLAALMPGVAAQPEGGHLESMPSMRPEDRVGCLYGLVGGQVSWHAGQGIRIGSRTFYSQSGGCRLSLGFSPSGKVTGSQQYRTEENSFQFYTGDTGELTQIVHAGDMTVNQSGALIENDDGTYAWWDTIPIPTQGRETTYRFDSNGLHQVGPVTILSDEQSYCAPQVRMPINTGLHGSLSFLDRGPSHPPGQATFQWTLHRR